MDETIDMMQARVRKEIRDWGGDDEQIGEIEFECPERGPRYIQELHNILTGVAADALRLLQAETINQATYDRIIENCIDEAKEIFWAWESRYRKQVGDTQSQDDLEKYAEGIYDQIVPSAEYLHGLAVDHPHVNTGGKVLRDILPLVDHNVNN